MGEYLVEMKGITKTFPGTKALDQVDLKLKAGEIHALLGENGAGKSTMMNILTGQIPMDAGDIYIDGKLAKISAPKDAFSQNIVLVPQELNLILEASIAENIFLGNEQTKGRLIDWKATQEEAKRLLKLLDVELDVTQKAGKLSAAYQQLVSIARALAYNPRLLILDEPTAVLTNREAESLFASMHRLQKQGTAMVFITHHLDEVMREADCMTIMRDGKLVRVADVKDITKDEIINAMAGRTVEKAAHIARTVSEEILFQANHLSRDSEFQDVSFDIKKGEVLCVAGLVGSGRTEIFKTVFGITEKEPGGKTYFEGNEVNIRSPRDAIALGMGYVSEERRHDGITPGMSVLENMLLPTFHKIKKKGFIDFKQASVLADDFIHKFKIKTPSHETLIRNLSGGNQQKVIVARWIAKGVKMLILDEPTRGIDVNAKVEIHKLIHELAQQDVAVVVISSEMEEVLELADRIMVIHQGKISGFVEDVDLATEESILKIAFNS
ncbi:MAG: sugar ABC transporter ATP-binding protein [Lachnospiraceae bacterium]|nr:sugar ABC transporter ATP-binding protein [Lachnospiraceae bacterium]